MWRLIFSAYFTAAVYAQNSRRPELDHGHGWDIRLAVPGKPGADYPTLNSIPRTSFSCSGKTPGYYTDVEAGCQVFRVCTLGSTYGFQSFLCPNGTLFNQEVLVCDWWMSVRCERSRQVFNNNGDKFGNLKLGPQLMKDIKNMLTHPMRHPYDKTIMKNNLIIMQDYKPPSGQLFPNGALISGPERPPSNVYVPAKQRQGNSAQNSFSSGDLSFAASTPSSQYIPALSNVIRPAAPRDIELLQPQAQSYQLLQNGLSGQTDSQLSQLTRPKNTEYITNNKIMQPSNTHKQNHNQRNIKYQSQSVSQNVPNSQSRYQAYQYNNNVNQPNPNKKQSELGNSNANQQYTYNSKQSGQLNQRNNIPEFSRTINGYFGRDAKQILVNPNTASHKNGKTLKFSRIVQKSSSGNPKSRVTFKTWIVRPSKPARLVAEPSSSSYTYDKPTKPPSENERVNTSNPKLIKVNTESEDVPYVYNRPETSNKQVIATVEDTASIYLPPTMPTLPNRPKSTTKMPQSLKQSRLYLTPTTYKPISKLYVPPSENTIELSRQYLGPNLSPMPETNNNYQNARLVASPKSTTEYKTVASGNIKNPSFTLTKQSHINTNKNNLTFADILTKEKLDITVRDIVKDTNKILETEPQEVLSQYNRNNEYAENLRNDNATPDTENQSAEILTPQPPTSDTKSEKIIATPSTDLEPPIDTSIDNNLNSNKLLNLPFYKESVVPTNTIERTVSLKITVPETVAEYLFNNSENESDSLEILNTGSSNYLVLTNDNLDEKNDGGVIPIGKLIWDKNISNSPALVYSFLADSINAAKEYSNIAKQNIISPIPTQSNIQNINNEDITDITTKISHLTSSQFQKSNQNNANLVNLPENTANNAHSKSTTDHSQRQFSQTHEENYNFSQEDKPEQLYSSRLQRLSSNSIVDNLQRNMNQIYSGQLYKLPVPEVTRQIYNAPNFMQSSNIGITKELGPTFSQRNTNRDINANNIQSNTETDVVNTESISFPSARQELPRTDESTFNTQEHSENIFADDFLRSDNGITAQVQDKIFGTLPHPLEDNKLVTYQKNKSYYLYSKPSFDNNDNIHSSDKIIHSSDYGIQENAKRSNELSNRVTFELLPSIGYELEDEREKQQLLNSLKINEFRLRQDDPKQNGKTERFDQKQELTAGVDFTILHPSSKKEVEQSNNGNTILYRGPSSYFAPQSSVGSLRENQQIKIYNTNSRIEQFDESNGYSKATPSKPFSF